MSDNTGASGKDKKLIQSIQRAVEIVNCFSIKDEKLGISEISRRLNLHKSTVFGIVATLEHYGCLERIPEIGQYKLGLKFLDLGNLVSRQLDVRRIARPYLDTVVETLKETGHLAILDGCDVIYIDKVDSARSIRMNSEVGWRRPAYCTGIGKAILSFLPGEEWKDHLPPVLESFTPNTITKVDDLEKEIERIRRNLYSEDNEEIEEGLCCVAVPIFNQENRVIASFSVSGPSVRMTKEKMQSVALVLKKVAQEISEKMGANRV